MKDNPEKYIENLTNEPISERKSLEKSARQSLSKPDEASGFAQFSILSDYQFPTISSKEQYADIPTESIVDNYLKMLKAQNNQPKDSFLRRISEDQHQKKQIKNQNLLIAIKDCDKEEEAGQLSSNRVIAERDGHSREETHRQQPSQNHYQINRRQREHSNKENTQLTNNSNSIEKLSLNNKSSNNPNLNIANTKLRIFSKTGSTHSKQHKQANQNDMDINQTYKIVDINQTYKHVPVYDAQKNQTRISDASMPRANRPEIRKVKKRINLNEKITLDDGIKTYMHEIELQFKRNLKEKKNDHNLFSKAINENKKMKRFY